MIDKRASKVKIIMCLLLICITGFSFSQPPKIKAFPTAEGFGKYATGGRGGKVIKVTNLNDSGKGSLREALMYSSGPRTIVFEVGGTITLKSYIAIRNGNVTIAGQTAPGDGILIRGSEFKIEASNVIVRHLRFRPGTYQYDAQDGLAIIAWGKNVVENIIIDHCSLSWAEDENLNIRTPNNGIVRNVTIQNSIISEGGYGILVSHGTQNITFYNNLFAHNQERSIRNGFPIGGNNFDFEMVNNLIYGFRSATVVSLGSKFTALNNHYKESRNTSIVGTAVHGVAAGQGRVNETYAYISGNIMPKGYDEYNNLLNPYLKSKPYISSGIIAINANEVANNILPHVGASLPNRDAVDVRIINQYKNNSGALAKSGIYPTIRGGEALVDTDNDGMPDAWEVENGFNPNDANDRNVIQTDGYSTLEYYLNGMSLQLSSVFTNAGKEVEICQGSSTTLTAKGGSAYLWSTGAKTASITVSPSSTTTYTVTAYNDKGVSDSDEVKVTVLPLLNVSAGEDVTINSGESVTLKATGASTYKWSTGESGAIISVKPEKTTTYRVTGSNDKCEATSTVKVTVVDSDRVVANAGGDRTMYLGTAITLTASGGASYLWNTGATTSSIYIAPTTSRMYTVTVYDSTGKFSSTDEAYVTVLPPPAVSAGEDVTINLGGSATLKATGASTYKWTTGESGAIISVKPEQTTTYTVTGYTDGLESTSTVKVTVEDQVVANAGGDRTMYLGTAITLTASGGASYLWNTGATTSSINIAPSTSRMYTVTVYDSTGKFSSTDEAYVTVLPPPAASASEDVTINLDESVTLKATGAGFSSEGKIANGIEVDILQGESINLSAMGGNIYKWKSGIIKPNMASVGQDISILPNENIVLSANSRGLENNEPITDLELLVHPNPTHGELNIKISGLTNVSNIMLYDLSGKLLYNETINTNNQRSFSKTMDLSDYESGIYILKVVNSQRVKTKKVVLK